MKVDGIGFDFGNTLVMDPFGKVMDLKAYDFVKTMGENGYEVSKKRLLEAWRKINEIMNYPFCSHFAQEIPLIEAMLEKLGIHKRDRPKIAQQLLVVYRSGLRQVIRKDKEVEQVRKVLGELKLRGKKLFILSNESVDTINMQLSWTGLGKFFDKIIVSERIGLEKPDIRLFRHMAREFDFPEGSILYVGDDPERDIKPPKSIGMKAILLKHPESMSIGGWRDYDFELKDNEKPDFEVKDLREILDIVE